MTHLGVDGAQAEGSFRVHLAPGEVPIAAPETARERIESLVEKIDIQRRVDEHPYAMVAAALGVGYLLGGGLFTPSTARVLRLGLRLAAFPPVRDSLITIAEKAVDDLMSSREEEASNPTEESSNTSFTPPFEE